MANNLGNKRTMANNIEYYLRKNEMGRKDLSTLVESPYTTVCDWINAKTYPRIDKIEKMAKIFGISKSDLVEDKNTVPKDGNEKELIKLFSNLDDKNKSVALDLLKALEASQDK